jgi:hypothetical protein
MAPTTNLQPIIGRDKPTGTDRGKEGTYTIHRRSDSGKVSKELYQAAPKDR